ncbi:hypothetical protein [Gluconacetobacter takamatsuzukensis]|uniref:Lipoprotein n=1 Tax=Gluconacetobacter takamatsuzukensis TaxID=1286190 RepID=A0A7W4KET7_9PROT|nr:hypothetical protein [Gluconacetobacter takamatsuzukensis]MBB2205589.1 hypothetical protein [Gluconacetobacter takamatsuzukensis]
MRTGSRALVLALLVVLAACGVRDGRGHGHRAAGPYLDGGAGYGMP